MKGKMILKDSQIMISMLIIIHLKKNSLILMILVHNNLQINNNRLHQLTQLTCVKYHCQTYQFINNKENLYHLLLIVYHIKIILN